MSNQPYVSVIVPIYNTEKKLRHAINCLVEQSLKNIEIILVDDGSTDKSTAIIDEYAKMDNRIIVIRKQNEGYGKACNEGISKAKGKYIAIFEPDDYADKNMYEDLFNLAEEYDADVAKSSFFINTFIKDKYITKKANLNKHFKSQAKTFTIEDCPTILQEHPSIWSCLYKLEFLKSAKIKFLEVPGSGWTDNLFQVQTMCMADKIAYCPRAHYFWTVEHEEPSDNLTDYSIPINRSLEINKWLRINNFDQHYILENIYKRELNYIKIILGMRKISSLKDCYSKIHDLLKTMDENIIENSSVISKREKNFYMNLKNNPEKVRINLKIRRIRRDLFSFKFSKDIKFIKILGKYLFYASNNM